MVARYPIVTINLKKPHLDLVIGHYNGVGIALAEQTHDALAAGTTPKGLLADGV